MKNLAKIVSGGIAALCLATALPASAAQLSGDARAAIPHDVQQLIVIDYRAMQNSPAAMQLKNKVMPPELKSLEKALQVSGMNDNHDVDELAFAAYRPKGSTGDATRIIGLAQGQFSLDDIMANFKKKKIKPVVLRDNKIYPDGRVGDAGSVSQSHHDGLRPDRFAEAGAGCARWHAAKLPHQQCDDRHDVFGAG